MPETVPTPGERPDDDPVRRAWRAASAVTDPELPTVTIEDLGVLRDVQVDGAAVQVDITPTYAGCPAMDVIRSRVTAALGMAGFRPVQVRTVLSPAWSTDMITSAGREKLAAAGIAPPEPANPDRPGLVRLVLGVRCPHCGAVQTSQLSEFGSTACKSLWRCDACQEPFERIKPL